MCHVVMKDFVINTANPIVLARPERLTVARVMHSFESFGLESFNLGRRAMCDKGLIDAIGALRIALAIVMDLLL